jgi:hypothetical protein
MKGDSKDEITENLLTPNETGGEKEIDPARDPSPYKHRNFFVNFGFCYLNPILKKANRNTKQGKALECN